VKSGRRKTSLAIAYSPEQRYECRDCPARCCRTWSVPVSPEVAHRAIHDPELRARLHGRAPAILAGGTLPMVEKDRQLTCVFLDEDDRCAFHKKYGHEALPAACQAYPFGFVKSERGAIQTLVSRRCPSIRDGYGEPLTQRRVEEKLAQAGGARSLAARMGLKSGRTLVLEHYTRLADVWRELFVDHPIEAVVTAYELTDALDAAIEQPEPDTKSFVDSLDTARERTPRARLSPRKKPRFLARLFFAHTLGALSYPSRLLTDAAALRPTLGQKLGALWNRLTWLLGFGSADLLYVERPVPIRAIERVPRFLGGELGARVNEYLREVVERRQLFTRQTYLTRVLVDLGLIAALVSRFARASAAAHERGEVALSDVLEGIGVAELLVTHQLGSESAVLANLRLRLMSEPETFRDFLASEV
jgi:lysine-N-methylase